MSDEVEPATETPAAQERDSSLYERWTDVRGEERTVAVLAILGVLLAPFLLVTLPSMLGLPEQLRVVPQPAHADAHLGHLRHRLRPVARVHRTAVVRARDILGTAAYSAGIFSAEVLNSPIAMILTGTAVAVLMAWIIGWISLRRGGIYFAILTLAFGQMVYYVFLSPLGNYTGGENGFTGVDVGSLFGVIELGSSVPFVPGRIVNSWMYLFVGTATVLAIVVGYRILNSPYGAVLRAVRENEQRAEFVGLNVWRYKLMSFIISGAFAGVAGSLYTVHQSYVPIENTLSWTVSGDIVVITVLGGIGSLFGPIFGAGLYMYVKNIVSGMPVVGPFWHLILGLVFVIVVVGLPDGVWGGIAWTREKVADALGGEDR